MPILGRGFDTGGYKCECIQGYEYPFQDLITYFDGQLVEAEFENLVKDKPTRYIEVDYFSNDVLLRFISFVNLMCTSQV